MWVKYNNNVDKSYFGQNLNLAIEYLVRTDSIKEFIEFPCSIFVTNKDMQVAITINEARNNSKLCVKNWFISDCKKDQPIPTNKEYMISKSDLFEHSATVLKGFNLINFECCFVNWSKNRGNGGHPMPSAIYENYTNNQLNPPDNIIRKELFLWNCFTKTYMPSIGRLIDVVGNIGFYSRSEFNLFFEEQNLIEEYFKNIWNCWLKWKKYMLFPTIPGELIFMKEYNQ